jgi:lipoate-protein ligase B
MQSSNRHEIHRIKTWQAIFRSQKMIQYKSNYSHKKKAAEASKDKKAQQPKILLKDNKTCYKTTMLSKKAKKKNAIHSKRPSIPNPF